MAAEKPISCIFTDADVPIAVSSASFKYVCIDILDDFLFTFDHAAPPFFIFAKIDVLDTKI